MSGECGLEGCSNAKCCYRQVQLQLFVEILTAVQHTDHKRAVQYRAKNDPRLGLCLSDPEKNLNIYTLRMI